MYSLPNELFMEPQKILEYTEESYCEMTPSEQGFLCGLIKENLPQKVLEVGVAGGGTTAVIMKCLNMVNPSASMFSVDLAEECYRRKGKQSGYQLLEVSDKLSNIRNHKFLLGSILPNRIDEIGANIDFVILDTTHLMPGEILDFLCVLPYLSSNAMVVLHDVTLNLSGMGGYSYATKILLDAVSGDKYYDYKNSPNIGAFRVNEDTKKNIANVFSALSITWQYKPSMADLMIYRDLYKLHYDKECIDLFDTFVGFNSDRIGRLQGEKITEKKQLISLEKKKEKARIARIDIRNKCINENSKNSNDVIIDNMFKNTYEITSPQWFCKNGKGKIIQSSEGFLKIRCTIIEDGILEISLRGIDYRENDIRIPIYIAYTSFSINGHDIISETITTCHDKPYIHNIPVKNGEELIISISWRCVKSDD